MSRDSARSPAFTKTPRLGAGLVLSLVFLVSGAATAAAQGNPVAGHWEGALRYRGADMPIRFHVESSGDSLVATLDIPSLVMAWEPVPTTPTRYGVLVEFPFGLGALSVEPKGDRVRAEKQLDDETLALDLWRAQSPPSTREEVVFRSGEVSLVGTLVVPNGKGPHPAVVLVHGSGRQGQSNWAYRSWADLFVRQGLAVLYYDKRGIGASGGEYGAGLSRLTEDVVAAVEFLKARSEVDPSRIGLKGSSQGAWISEAAASEIGDVAFLLLVSAAASTPRDQELQKIEYGMRDDGKSEDQIENALAYAGLYFYVARTGEGWPLLQEAVERAQAEDWGQYVDQPRSEADLAWWRENHAFQPAEVVRGSTSRSCCSTAPPIGSHRRWKTRTNFGTCSHHPNESRSMPIPGPIIGWKSARGRMRQAIGTGPRSLLGCERRLARGSRSM